MPNGSGAIWWGKAMKHELKCWPSYFNAILSGAKTHEIRDNTRRDFSTGDTLELVEYDPASKFSAPALDARRLRVRVTYLTQGIWGLPQHLTVMSIRIEP